MESENTNNEIENLKSNGFGGIIGAVIIIIILIIGGWYVIGNRVQKIQDQKEQQTASSTIEIITGTSTEIRDIQTDLDNLDLDILN